MTTRICRTCGTPFETKNVHFIHCDACCDMALENIATPQPHAAEAGKICDKCKKPYELSPFDNMCAWCGQMEHGDKHPNTADLLSKIARLEAAGDAMVQHFIDGREGETLIRNWQSAKQ